jgi:hypothetical protein
METTPVTFFPLDVTIKLGIDGHKVGVLGTRTEAFINLNSKY